MSYLICRKKRFVKMSDHHFITVCFHSGVLPDIQEEFEISDAGKAGFIQTAFVILYAVGAPSFGYWGDR